jgi:D-alanyl-D-alanine carboxypeptidase (penicillin-binding protein 5/6)
VLVGAAHGNGARIVSVVLRAPSEAARDADTLALLRWGIGQYQRKTIVRPGRVVARLPVAGHEGLRIGLVTRRGATFTVRRGARLRLRVRAPEQLEGPIARGTRVGSVEVLYLGRTVKTLGLVTARAVPAKGTVKELTDSLGPSLVALALLLLVVGVLLAGLRIRAVLVRRRGTRTAP